MKNNILKKILETNQTDLVVLSYDNVTVKQILIDTKEALKYQPDIHQLEYLEHILLILFVSDKSFRSEKEIKITSENFGVRIVINRFSISLMLDSLKLKINAIYSYYERTVIDCVLDLKNGTIDGITEILPDSPGPGPVQEFKQKSFKHEKDIFIKEAFQATYSAMNACLQDYFNSLDKKSNN